MIFLSQRDPRWKDVKIGNSTSSIGSYGCLITSLAMYVGKTPIDVNDILKNGGGYQNDLFVWSKCTLLGLNQTYASPKYTSSAFPKSQIDVLCKSLDAGYPALAEIDFNPATDGEEMHFILITRRDGDTIYAADPWTGTEINLDVYGGASRAIICIHIYDKKIELVELNEPTEDEKRALSIIKTFKENTEKIKEGNFEGAANAAVGSFRELEGAKTVISTLNSFRDGVARQVGVEGETDTSRIVTKLSETIKESDLAQKEARAGLDLFQSVKEWVNGQTWVFPDQVDDLLIKFEEKIKSTSPPPEKPAMYVKLFGNLYLKRG